MAVFSTEGAESLALNVATVMARPEVYAFGLVSKAIDFEAAGFDIDSLTYDEQCRWAGRFMSRSLTLANVGTVALNQLWSNMAGFAVRPVARPREYKVRSRVTTAHTDGFRSLMSLSAGFRGGAAMIGRRAIGPYLDETGATIPGNVAACQPYEDFVRSELADLVEQTPGDVIVIPGGLRPTVHQVTSVSDDRLSGVTSYYFSCVPVSQQ